jgi:hydroxymethylpyrimidine/phosphomethylpyrimidine kinase
MTEFTERMFRLARRSSGSRNMRRSEGREGMPTGHCVSPPVALTIAGSDSGGGAGIQADLKTFAMHGVFGTSVVTALTAQNTVAVQGIQPTPGGFTAAQLDALLADLPPAAAKTGMLATADNIRVVAARAAALPNLVVDPVLVASTGRRLFEAATERAYLEVLFPHARVVTPNLREAAALTGRELSTVDDMVAAAEWLASTGAECVVVKGGHLAGPDAVDVVWHRGEVELLRAPWVRTGNNHGTGCTFAAALAARLALGLGLADAIRAAKTYVAQGLSIGAAWRLGAGHGPLGWAPVETSRRQ